jgi:hypothetical protein
MDLTLLWTWQAFFRPRWIWRLSLPRLLLSLCVITIHPCFITCYDIRDEVGVVSGLFTSPLQTETRWAFWSSLSSLGINLAEMRLMFNLSAKMRWTVPYDSPTISQTSWIVCLRSARIALWTFAMFSCVVLVDSCPECSSLSTDVRPSLKRLYHKKKFCFGSWHYLQRLPVAFCGFLQQFFKIETKFDAYSLLLKISHIGCKKNRWITKT